MEKRLKNLKKAYVKWSQMKYGNRRPLIEARGDKTIVTIYAHDLDGCPLRAVYERTTTLPRIRKSHMDRGDSFEQGFGVVHGLPQALEVAIDVTDVVHDIVPRGRKVYLHGTPDFVFIDEGDLYVLDAKSPYKRSPTDGPKGYWVTRMRTYAYILRRYRRTYAETEASHIRLNGIELPHPKKYVIESARHTYYPVARNRVGVWDTGNVRTYVIVDSSETRTFHDLYVSPNDDDVVKRLRYFVKLVVSYSMLGLDEIPDDVREYIANLHEDEKRKRECSYCPLLNCRYAIEGTKTFRLSVFSTTRNDYGRKVTVEHVDELIEDEDGRKRHRRPSNDYVFYVRDQDLVERMKRRKTSSVIVKAKKVNKKTEVRERYRVYYRMPAKFVDEFPSTEE